MPKIALTSGTEFDAGEGETILAAANRAGIVLPYGCSTGRCGACVGRVLSGETVSPAPEIGLSIEERAEGLVLLCTRVALSDVTVSASEVEDFGLAKPRLLPAKIRSIERLSQNVILVTLRLPPSSKFKFFPGQYINVSRAGIGIRSYSIANAPKLDGTIELCISFYEKGLMSEYWFDRANVDDLLQISGPHGTFFFRPTLRSNIVFLATGTGIAPVRAILQDLKDNSAERFDNFKIFWGLRAEADVFWDFKEILPDLQFTTVLSRSSSSANAAKRYVQDALLSSDVDLADAIVYACGNPEMIRAARQSLTKKGLRIEDFYSDSFVASDSLN